MAVAFLRLFSSLLAQKNLSYDYERFLAGLEGFEPPKHEASDLQSDPFGRSGNLPCTEKIGAVEE